MTTILLDCDGVLCDFSAGVLKRLRMPNHTVTNWDFSCTGRPPTEVRTAINHTMDNCHRLYPYPGTLQKLAALRRKTDVLCCTALMTAERGWWLETQLGFRSEEIFLCKGAARARISADIFVDDHPENVLAWGQANPYGRPVLFSRGYNTSAPGDLERIECLSALFS